MNSNDWTERPLMKLLLNLDAWERFQAALSDARLRAVEEGGLVVWGDSDESFHVENARYPRMAHDVRIVECEGRAETWCFDVEPEDGVPEFEDPGNLPESLCEDGSVAVYEVTQ